MSTLSRVALFLCVITAITSHSVGQSTPDVTMATSGPRPGRCLGSDVDIVGGLTYDVQNVQTNQRISGTIKTPQTRIICHSQTPPNSATAYKKNLTFCLQKFDSSKQHAARQHSALRKTALSAHSGIHQ